MKEYRKNVAAIILNTENQIWLGERADRMAWGFPQGGIDPGETPQGTLIRELNEELGLHPEDYQILAEHPRWLRYDFPADLTFKTWTYKGQEQKYFLIRLSEQVKFDFTSHPEEIEFRQYQWVDLADFPYEKVGFKSEIYRAALKAFEAIITPK